MHSIESLSKTNSIGVSGVSEFENEQMTDNIVMSRVKINNKK